MNLQTTPLNPPVRVARWALLRGYLGGVTNLKLVYAISIFNR